MGRVNEQMIVSKEGIISSNLRKLRLERGWSQSKLVAEMQLLGSSISIATYKKIEKDSRNIKAEDLAIAKTALGTSFEELFAGVMKDIPNR